MLNEENVIQSVIERRRPLAIAVATGGRIQMGNERKRRESGATIKIE